MLGSDWSEKTCKKMPPKNSGKFVINKKYNEGWPFCYPWLLVIQPSWWWSNTLFIFRRRWQCKHRKVQRRKLGRWRWKPTRHQVDCLCLCLSSSLSLSLWVNESQQSTKWTQILLGKPGSLKVSQDQGVQRKWPDWLQIWIRPTHFGGKDSLPYQHACLRGGFRNACWAYHITLCWWLKFCPRSPPTKWAVWTDWNCCFFVRYWTRTGVCLVQLTIIS